MNRVLVSFVGLLSAISGCASSPTVTPLEAAHTVPPVHSTVPEDAREFHIPAGDAPTALNEFARQAHTQVLFDYDGLRTRQTRSVEGTLLPWDALRSLLKETGLVAREVDERTVAILPDPSGHALR